MVWVARPDGTGEFTNRRLQTFTGVAGEALRGEGWTQLIHPDDVAGVVSGWRSAHAAGQPYSSVHRARRRDGEYRWVEARAAPVRDGGGQVVRWIGTWSDVHERVVAETAVRESARIYRAIGEAIQYGVWVCAPDGRNVYASESFLQLMGKTQQECSEFGWVKALHPDDAGRTMAAWKECVRSGGSWDIEHRYRGVDGKWHPVLARGVPVRNESGEVICWAGINLDISRLKEAEQALRDSEERFRALADSMPQLAWTARPDGHITWYNRRWYEYTGTHPDEMHGWGWRAVHDPAKLPEVLRRWRASIATGAAFDMEFPLRGVDGTFRRFLTRVFPLKDAEGKVLQWFGTHTDVTDLVTAQEALEKADRRKNEFIGMLSHEVRNPLSVIQSAHAVLEHADVGTEQADRARAVIGRQVRHLARLVDDLLDMTRIARGKVQLQTACVDLGDVVRHAVEDHRPLVARRGLALELHQPDGAVYVRGDTARLSQVVGNLLQNAAKFTNEGGQVRVSVERRDRDALVTVKDDGVGVDPDLLPVVFEPFIQADRTLHRAQGGLGLGLALVKGIVELHGGSVEVRSDGAGRGAQFMIRLPAVEPAGSSTEPGRATPAASRRILVIEDNEDAAAMLRDVLVFEGHEVLVAADGREGLDVAAREAPDVVLCDIGLPTLDGYEVARRLRAAGNAAMLVALTGYASSEDAERARQAGFDHHLPKPTDPRELVRLLASGPTCRGSPRRSPPPPRR